MMNRTDARIAGKTRASRAAGVENHLGARAAAASGCGFQQQRLNPIRREALSKRTPQPAGRSDWDPAIPRNALIWPISGRGRESLLCHRSS